MDKFKENQGDPKSKFGKRKQITRNKFQVPIKCQDLKSTIRKQTKNAASEEKVSLDVKETSKNPDANEVPFKGKAKKENGVLRIEMEYEAFSDYSNITIPLVGKSVFQNDEKPFTKCYNLAEERNKKRFAYMKETGEYDEFLKFRETKSNLSESDKKKNDVIKKKKRHKFSMLYYRIM